MENITVTSVVGFSIGDTIESGEDTRETRFLIESISSRINNDLSSIKKGLVEDRDYLTAMIPASFYSYVGLNETRFQSIKEYSLSITDNRVYSIACSIYSLFVMAIIEGAPIWVAYSDVKREMKNMYPLDEYENDLKGFSRILEENLALYGKEDINKENGIISLLECVLWSFLNGDDYKDSILRGKYFQQSNKGVLPLIGCLSSMYNEYEDIPENYLELLSNLEKIKDQGEEFHSYLIGLND